MMGLWVNEGASTMKYKLLLVDDNVDMLLIGKRIFGRAGYDFYTARNGHEGLESAKFHKPDVIVLDFILPDITGKQFIQKLHTQPQYESIRNIPIVVLTAKADEVDNLMECYRMGMRAFLNKPFGHRELVNVVDNVVRLSKLESNKMQPPPRNGKSHPTSAEHETEWMDDLSLATSTIASLCKQLFDNEMGNLTEQQKMDVYAVYNSSKRMSRILNRKNEKLDSLVSN